MKQSASSLHFISIMVASRQANPSKNVRYLEDQWSSSGPRGRGYQLCFAMMHVGREEGSSGVETGKEKIDPHSKCNKQEAEKVVSIDRQFYNCALMVFTDDYTYIL